MLFEYLVRECLRLRVDTARDVERHWGLEPEDIDRLEIRSAPSFEQNLFGSAAIAERFGDLSDVGCFYRLRNNWLLDVDERFAPRGLILPARDPHQPIYITGLKVFRHAKDERPFMLKLRQERIAA